MNTIEDKREYAMLQSAYDFFNAKFFDSRLPKVFFTIDWHNKKSNGYFCPHKLVNKEDTETKSTASVIALNPDHLAREVYEILATLVHEMCHVWEFEEFIKDPYKLTSYHSKRFEKKLSECNLKAVINNKSRSSCSTVIPDDGIFKGIADEYLKTKEFLSIASTNAIKTEAKKKAKAKNKTKYVCTGCKTNIWGKAGLNLHCNECDMDFEEDV
jgi:predicted SprT family Zn-dependent metalloprotease